MAHHFQSLFGAPPEGVWAAPGRINLIGEHTDYNDGLVLPLAIPQHTAVAIRRRSDDLLRLHSRQVGGPPVELRVTDLVPGSVGCWAKYPAAVVWALREDAHPVGGADLYVDSDVPAGAGLSSSAALECAVATACNDLHGLGLSRTELALAAQRAENEFVGVPCGVMDQMASMSCTPDAALLLDTRNLGYRHVPLALDGLRLLVIDTRVKHDLADGTYAKLRAGCERAAGLLGIPALRDLHPGGLATALDQLPAELRPLVRHVVTENARVEQAVALLNAGDPAGLGPILTAGHASLRDDYRVSCPETDLAADAAEAAGALGARMTGGGFGGSVIALVPEAAVDTVRDAVTTAFRHARHRAPRTFTATASAGARRCTRESASGAGGVLPGAAGL
ncbi:galactokinase [Kitasatospora aburaviensis]